MFMDSLGEYPISIPKRMAVDQGAIVHEGSNHADYRGHAGRGNRAELCERPARWDNLMSPIESLPMSHGRPRGNFRPTEMEFPSVT
jgi:hypothetical protein